MSDPNSDHFFYTVSDARFFAGTAAMLNSLRLTGNEGDVLVVDVGLSEEQRRRLAASATVVTLPDDVVVSHPMLAKTTPDLFRSSGVVVFVDSDMIVTRRLDDVVATARSGQLALFPDHEATRDRRFDEWAATFELSAPLRLQRYVNGGALALSLDRWRDFVARWREANGRIPAGEIGADPRSPFWAGDQDSLNALLMSEVPPEAQTVADERHSLPPDALREVVVLDEERVACSYRGARPAFLHFSLAPKAWEPRAWRRIRKDDAYVRLFPRLAFAEDVPVRLRPEEVAVWLRHGRAAHASRVAADFANRAIGAVKDGNPGPFRRLARRPVPPAPAGGAH